MSNLTIKTAASIQEIDPTVWDRLSDGRPFQSHRWYAYGERVMADCLPVYLLAYHENNLVARAAFWLIRNEPLPKMLGLLRRPAMTAIKHWPLLVCRSPLAYAAGLIISSTTMRSEILSALAEAAVLLAKCHGVSFILFDYLSKTDACDWPGYFAKISNANSGMKMESRWASMDEYMASVGKKDRQHYKRVLREAEKLGIQISRHFHAECIDEALPLIQNVETNHGALANPWARRMLENMKMADSLFLTATIEKKLVGCGLLVEDNHSQMTSILGLAEDIPYVYFMLAYESLKIALEHHVHLLRWGSGAYEVKQRLGFSLEDNGTLLFTAANPILQKTLQWIN